MIRTQRDRSQYIGSWIPSEKLSNGFGRSGLDCTEYVEGLVLTGMTQVLDEGCY